MQKEQNKFSARKLLKQIEDLYQLAEKHKNYELLMHDCQQHVMEISGFYGCNEFEAALLAIIIYKHVQEKPISNRTIATTLGIPFVEMGEMVQALKKLCRLNLIRPAQDWESGVKYHLHK